MTKLNAKTRSPSYGTWVTLVLLVAIALFFLRVALYDPDRPLPMIAPGTSAGPAFRVQVLRPRESLPLGGLAPPEWFGVDARLGFDSTGEGVEYRITNTALEFSADDWKVRIMLDREGQVTAESEVVFNLVFEDEIRRVRCRPSTADQGVVEIGRLAGTQERYGEFQLELGTCEDAETGESLGWPPKPLVIQGSFDRLRADGERE